MAGGLTGAVIEDATIVVTDDRITAVGPRASTPIPGGARTFDASGKTVIPGIIDVHSHCHYANQGLLPDAFWAYRANLAYGVTTIHDPSATSWEVFTQSEMVEAGAVVRARIDPAGIATYGAGATGRNRC